MTEEEIFGQAIRLPVDERAKFIADACGADSAEQRRVERLVQAHEQPDSLLEQDSPASTVDNAPGESIGQHVGPYKLLQMLGEGGMGTVYLAERLQPVKQRVALKIIKSGMDSKKFVARFEAERQALAMMDHPNIAKVFDAGCTELGRPYFVMELVKGIPITDFCDQNKLGTQERLELFKPVCHAVQHAHQKGVIHRDLKPSNVMVAMYDDRPVPKVIDFGLAKAANQQLTDKTLFTDVGSILGTWEYMSPEQAVVNQLDVDTRTDVYSLGVILYELLTGVTPFDRKQLREVQLRETLRVIQEVEPPKPSTRVTVLGTSSPSIATHRSTTVGALTKFIRGDLDWIVMKALEKDRKRRYDSASRMADDVAHFLAGEAIEARPPTLAYRFSKTWLRHKWPISVAATFVAALVVGTIVLSSLFIDRSRTAAKLENINNSLTDSGRKLKEKQFELLAQQHRSDQSLYAAHMQNAMTAYERNDMRLLSNLVDKYVGSDLREWEWHFLDRLRNAEKHTIFAHTSSPLRLAASPTEDMAVVAHPEDDVMFTVVKAGKAVRTIGTKPGKWSFHYAHFSKDGKQFLHSNSDFTQVVIRDSNDLLEVAHLSATKRITNAIFSEDGSKIYAAVKQTGVNVYSKMVDGWEGPETWPDDSIGGPYRPMCLLGSGLLAVGIGEKLALWDTATGQKVSESKDGHTRKIQDLVSVDEQNWVITAGQDRMIRVWEKSSDQEPHEIKEIKRLGPFDADVRCLAYDPATKQLAAGFRDRQINTWELPSFAEKETIRGTNGLYALAFDRVGNLLYGANGVCMLGEKRDPPIQRIRFDRVDGPAVARAWVGSLRFHPDNRRLVVQHKYEPILSIIHVDEGGVRTVNVIDAADGIANVSKRICQDSVLAIASRAGNLFLFDFETGQSVQQIQCPDGSKPSVVEFGVNFETVIVGTEDGRIIELPIDPGSAELGGIQSRLATERVGRIKVTEIGEVVVSDGDGRVGIWKNGVQQKVLGPLQGNAVGLDTQGGTIAIGLFHSGRPGSNLLFGPLEGDLKDLMGHTFSIMDLAIIEDGKTLISVGADRELQFWDLESSERRFAIHDDEIMSNIAVSPDESIVAVGTREGTVILYHRGMSK